MKNSKVLKGFLIVAGLILTAIGGATLLIPEVMKANSGIDIGGNVSVLNDIRASSGLLLAIGLLSISGAFSERLRFTSALIAPIAFLSIGIGRVVSIVQDGMPVDDMIKATGLEFILGTVGLILFLVFREKK